MSEQICDTRTWHQHLCSRMLEAGFVLLYVLALSSFYTWTVEILSIRLLPGKFFLCCGGIYGHWLLWFYHFFLSLSFVDNFLFAKRKGAIFILANCDRRMCCYFVPKVIICGSPYWALAFEGNLGEVLCSLLTWHVLHTLLCYSFVVVFSLHQTFRPDFPFRKVAPPTPKKIITFHCIILYYIIILFL